MLAKIDTHLRESTGHSGCAAPVHAQDYHHFSHRRRPPLSSTARSFW